MNAIRLTIIFIVFILSAVNTSFAQQREKMLGKWYNNTTGESLRIERNGSDYEVTLSSHGNGLLYTGGGGGANIRIEGQNFACRYYQQFIGNGKVMAHSRIGGNSEVCISGTFSRLDDENGDFRSNTNNTSSQSSNNIDPCASKYGSMYQGVDGNCWAGGSSMPHRYR